MDVGTGGKWGWEGKWKTERWEIGKKKEIRKKHCYMVGECRVFEVVKHEV
jgi:hypothetical protein